MTSNNLTLKNTQDAALQNPASFAPDQNPIQQTDYEHPCSEPVMFAMQDKHHEFSLGLSVVLTSLRMAEKLGYVPPLDGHWWRAIHEQYGGKEWDFK